MNSASADGHKNSAATKGRILVVDDDPDFAEGMDLLLEPEGYEVAAVHNTADARDIVGKFNPDIALIDIRLSGSSGISLIAELRKQHPRILCVMMTAFASTDTAIKAMQQGAYDYLVKPFNVNELLMTVERCFERQRLEADKTDVDAALRVRNQELEQTLEKLAKSEMGFRSLVEGSPICIQEMDLAGRIVSMNRAGLSMMNIAKASDIAGRDYFEFVDKDNEEDVRAKFALACSGSACEIEYGVKLGESSRILASSFAPLVGPDGATHKIMAIVQDITERKAAEVQLQQSQKMEAIGQLTGGISHDINNHLAVIMGNAELLTSFLGDDNELTRFSDEVVEAATRGAQLTQRLLAFSRRQPLNLHNTQLTMLLADMEDMLDRTLGETIEIESSVAPGLWQVLADSGQIENSILNLAINARDAMPDGGKLIFDLSNVTIDNKGDGDLEAGEYVLLKVTDNGTGIRADAIDRVFEPFFTTKKVGEGSGLGLSIIYGIAKQSNGDVSIESELGVGTTVSLYLPKSMTSRLTEQTEEAVQGDDPMGRGESVLVVEDDESVRSLACEMLESLGYRVCSAENGIKAIEMLKRTEPTDLVLSDVILPGGMSGLDVVKEAKHLIPDAKVLFMSGYTNESTSIGELLEYATAVLNKPFRRAELARKVRETLDQA